MHRVLHERRHVPSNSKVRVDPEAIIPLRFGLQQSNLSTGYNKLMAVSDPHSDQYGKYIPAAEVYEIFAPSEETIGAVKDWLTSAGIDERAILGYENRGWLAIDIPVFQAEALLSAEYNEYEVNGETRIGCDEYSLPSHISPHIDYIKPGVALSAAMKRRTLRKRHSRHRDSPRSLSARSDSSQEPDWQPPLSAADLPPELKTCGYNITPTCIQALYGIPRATRNDTVNMLGMYERYDAFAAEDLWLSFRDYAPWVPDGTLPSVISVDGAGIPPLAPDSKRVAPQEPEMDLVTAMPLIYPQTVIVYQVDVTYSHPHPVGLYGTFLDGIDGSYCNYSAYGINGDDPDIDPTYPDPVPKGYHGERQCGAFKPTRVLSISYGQPEADFPPAYARRQCNEMMKLALQGHTVLIASGDYGVAQSPGSSGNEYGCLSKQAQNRTIFNADISGCPYVTSVGGTMLYENQTVHDRESAMQINFGDDGENDHRNDTEKHRKHKIHAPKYESVFGSAGGFANYFSPPAYQAKAVEHYLHHYAPNISSYIANYNGTNLGLCERWVLGPVNEPHERDKPVVGTSISAPIWASVITLINEERTAVGKGPVGFINPVLYAHPEVLNDIVNGSNPGCGSPGFSAAPGWDPVTGLGTPNYPEMLKLFMSLP